MPSSDNAPPTPEQDTSGGSDGDRDAAVETGQTESTGAAPPVEAGNPEPAPGPDETPEVAQPADPPEDSGEGSLPATTESIEDDPADEAGCNSLRIRYDLEGSVYRVDANDDRGDGTYPVEQPYDARDHAGPGTITLRVPVDDSGAPVEGAVSVVSYQLEVGFTVTVVDTDLLQQAGTANPDNSHGACGVAHGTRDALELAWADLEAVDPVAQMDEVHTVGAVSCQGLLCGLVPAGTLGERDSSGPQGLGRFVFDDDSLGAFTMPETMTGSDPAGSTYVTLRGRELERICEPAPTCD